MDRAAAAPERALMGVIHRPTIESCVRARARARARLALLYSSFQNRKYNRVLIKQPYSDSENTAHKTFRYYDVVGKE